MSDSELLMKYFDDMPKCWRDDGYIAAKEAAKRLCSHLESESSADVDSKSLDDIIPWESYPLRLRKVGIFLSYQILRRSVSELPKRTYIYPVKTFRELLLEGRRNAISIRGCGPVSIKTLDDEFTSRNCHEWLSS